MAKVSYHGKKRIKQRFGVPKKSSGKLVDRAWEQGLKHDELKGHLRKYVDSRVINSKATPRIYGQHLYLFNSDGTLRTAYDLPSNLKSLAVVLAKKKRE